MDEAPSQLSAESERAPTLRIAVIGIRGLPANYGGLETCAEEVCKRWAAAGHDVVVYCRKNRYATYPRVHEGVKLEYTRSIPTQSLDTISHTLFSIAHLLVFNRGYRNVHLYNTGNALFLPLLKLFGKRVILSGDGIEWKRKKWGRLAKSIHKLGEYLAVRFADAIVVDNVEVGKYYLDTHAAPTRLIAYGAKPIIHDHGYAQKLLSKHGLKPKEYFLFVGRIVPEKGVQELIDAYAAIDTNFPLVIVGDDHPHSEYRNKVFSRASDNVRLLGFLYDKEYEQLLVNAYLYVSASQLEGTSPALLSAMGAGVGCLVNGIPENIATARGAVETFRENDQSDFRRLLQLLADDPDRVTDLGLQGKACVDRFYQWDRIAEQYLELFGSPGKD